VLSEAVGSGQPVQYEANTDGLPDSLIPHFYHAEIVCDVERFISHVRRYPAANVNCSLESSALIPLSGRIQAPVVERGVRRMDSYVTEILLWLFVINHGIAFGAAYMSPAW